jgi:putative (di)nucleoside polyphosphate hydrolase
MMIKEPGYRLNVGIIIINDKGNLLLCKRKNTNSWQFPQGGINKSETPLQAAKRELFEEVGIESNCVKLLSTTKKWFKYDIPKEKRKNYFHRKNFKGQKQKWFMFKLLKNINIHFDNDPDGEFIDYKWVPYWYPLHTVIEFKKEVYRSVLVELRQVYSDMFCND